MMQNGRCPGALGIERVAQRTNIAMLEFIVHADDGELRQQI